MQHQEYARMFALEDHYWWFVARRELALSLLKSTKRVHSDSLVLDVGCGTGAVLGELNQFCIGVGFDFSAEALSFCTDRGLPRLVQGDAHRLPFRANSLDGAVSLDVFEHLSDDDLAFRQVFATLKPGAVLIASVPAFRFLWGPHDVALMHFRRYTRKEFNRKLREAGFQIAWSSYSIFALFPLVCLIRAFEKRKRGDAKASLPRVPEFINRLLIFLQRFEARIMTMLPLPWGSSVVVVAKKPLG